MSDLQARFPRLVLDGHNWCGPYYSEAVKALHLAFAAHLGCIDPAMLDGAVRSGRLAAYERRGQLTTPDGYAWMWHRKFMASDGTILIATPFCNDTTMVDGTTTDRSVAAFYLGNVAFRQIDELAQALRLNLPQPPKPAAAPQLELDRMHL